ncbi:MAG: hypothetical protein KAH23_03405 [Kiritimatiellae bacterium]|nr:hypothetical protein [Kiritimatiellia bacterium]
MKALKLLKGRRGEGGKIIKGKMMGGYFKREGEGNGRMILGDVGALVPSAPTKIRNEQIVELW